MRETKLGLLTDGLFLSALVILLANDFVFKYQSPGVITGKLSDFTGLFLFPFFWSVFFERYRVKIYLLTGLMFTLWKLPVSSGAIEELNNITGAGFHRIVDLTDLLALSVLPLSLLHFNRKVTRYRDTQPSRSVSVGIIVVSMFSFVATTLPHHLVKHNIQIDKKYTVQLSKHELFAQRMRPKSDLSNDLEANLADTLFILMIPDGARHLNAIVKIYESEPGRTHLDLVALHSVRAVGRLFMPNDKATAREARKVKEADVVKAFEREIVGQWNEKPTGPNRIEYWNPKTDSTFDTQY